MYIYIYIYGGDRDVIVSVAENRHLDLSSYPRRGCLHFI